MEIEPCDFLEIFYRFWLNFLLKMACMYSPTSIRAVFSTQCTCSKATCKNNIIRCEGCRITWYDFVIHLKTLEYLENVLSLFAVLAFLQYDDCLVMVVVESLCCFDPQRHALLESSVLSLLIKSLAFLFSVQSDSSISPLLACYVLE